MKTVKLTKIIVFIALSTNCLMHGMSGDNGSRSASNIASSLRRWWSRLDWLSLSPRPEPDPELLALLQPIAERVRVEQERSSQESDQQVTTQDLLRSAEPLLRLERGPSLGRTIVERFLRPSISLDELVSNTIETNYAAERLNVTARTGQRITSEQIELIVQIFPNIRDLNVAGTGLSDNTLQVLAQQRPFASRLTGLHIGSNSNITLAGLEANLGAFESLISLSVSYNEMGDEDLAIIAAQPFAGNLVSLNLTANQITAEGMRNIIGKFGDLISLNVSFNGKIGDSGLAIIAAQPFARKLISLNLAFCGITAQGIEKNMSEFMSLTDLDISMNPKIGDKGLAALAKQPFAPKLTRLNIGSIRVTAEGIRGNIGLFTNLTSLNVQSNTIGDQGLAVIAQQPYASQLELTAPRTGGTEEWVEQNKNKFKLLNNS